MTPLKPRELLWYLPGHGGGVTLTEARTHPKSAVLCLVWSRRIHAGVNSAMLLSHSHPSTIPPSAPPVEQSIHRRVLQELCLIQEGKYSSLRQHQRTPAPVSRTWLTRNWEQGKVVQDTPVTDPSHPRLPPAVVLPQLSPLWCQLTARWALRPHLQRPTTLTAEQAKTTLSPRTTRLPKHISALPAAWSQSSTIPAHPRARCGEVQPPVPRGWETAAACG